MTVHLCFVKAQDITELLLSRPLSTVPSAYPSYMNNAFPLRSEHYDRHRGRIFERADGIGLALVLAAVPILIVLATTSASAGREDAERTEGAQHVGEGGHPRDQDNV